MTTDRETKALLKALVDGQVKLAEGQDLLRREITTRIDSLGHRVENLAEAILRGFTNGAGRDHAIEKRVEDVEKRVDTLERR